MRTALVVALLALGLLSIGERGWAVALAVAFLFAVVGWQVWGEPRFVAPMPDCDACLCAGRDFDWIGMRQFAGSGVFGQTEPGWILASVDHLVTVPVEVPLATGGILKCSCRYWFRSADYRTCWILHEKGPPTLYAKRTWGRWSRV